jgi:hypothetical protein
VTGDRQSASDGAGWEYVRLAVDDHSRVGFATIEPDERGISACRMLLKTLRYYRGLGVTFTRVMTDNGACYWTIPVGMPAEIIATSSSKPASCPAGRRIQKLTRR